MTDQPADDWRTKALANFPFEIVEAAGDNALAKWQELKAAGRGVPVVIGDIDGVLELFLPAEDATLRSVQEILAAADAIRFPNDLDKMRRIESDDEEPRWKPPLGEWPAEVANSPGLAVAYDVLSDSPLPKVHIVLVATDDPTTVPAHLRLGGWNECPAPEYHVAALRHWRDRYGAELVGLNMDTFNLRVTRKPATRDEAIALAHVQYAYCNDIVDQGTESISRLAAELMAHDWWFFWWD
jgi:hypothetical protein